MNDDYNETKTPNRLNIFNSKNLNILLIIIIIAIIVVIYMMMKTPSDKPKAKQEVIFELIGSDVILQYGEEYIEYGCKYIDENNADLSNQVQIINNINNKVPGNYKVIYRYNNDIISRNVTVLNVSDATLIIEYTLSNQEYTNQNIDIIYRVTGNTFYRIELPNGKMSTEKEGKVTVNKNGTYIFKAYNEAYQSFQKEVIVTNIIKEKPTGTCTLTVMDSGGEIEVLANNTPLIKGYVYRFGKTTTGIMFSNKYSTNTLNKKAIVTIYDKAGNSRSIACTTIDKTTPKPTPTPKPTATPIPQKGVTSYSTRSYTTRTLNGTKYMLYKPSESFYGDIPLLLYFPGAAGLNVGLPTYLSAGSNFPYYIAIPVDNRDSGFAMNLINHLKDELQVDSNRVYVSGASSGTKPAIITAFQHKSTFAGVIVVASYSDTPSYNPGCKMWFFQGTNDSYQMVVNIVNSINRAGGNAKLTSYSGGHDAPLGAFKRDDLTEWILNK